MSAERRNGGMDWRGVGWNALVEERHGTSDGGGGERVIGGARSKWQEEERKLKRALRGEVSEQ